MIYWACRAVFSKIYWSFLFLSLWSGERAFSLRLQGVEHFELVPDIFLFPFSALLIAAMLLSRTFLEAFCKIQQILAVFMWIARI